MTKLLFVLVNLSGNLMGDRGAVALAAALGRCARSIHALCLARNCIGSAGARAVSQLAARCPKLGVLYIILPTFLVAVTVLSVPSKVTPFFRYLDFS